MEGKITDTLKPLLTKRSSEVGYWKLNEMPGRGECLRQKVSILEKWEKWQMRKLWKISKVKMGEESIKSVESHMQKGVTVNGWESRDLNLNFEQVKFGLW